jgi:Dyp-type peroxidase family
MVDLAEVQSLVLRPSEPQTMELVFLRCPSYDSLRDLLAVAAESVTVASEASPAQGALNIGLTGAGALLADLGSRVYAALPATYLRGMRNAASRLGDPDPDTDPDASWHQPFRPEDKPVHVVAIAVGPDAGVGPTNWRGLDWSAVGAEEAGRWTGTRRGGYEPFGFRDGVSDPVIEGSGRAATPGNGVWDATRQAWRAVRAGEAVLGYVDESGSVAGHPDAAHVERDGSYLVIRKLEQDVEGFERACREWADELNATGPAGSAPWTGVDVAEQMVGRHKDGRVLGQPPGAEPTNDFLYRQRGTCPVGASPASHIRRSNPRDDLEAAEQITKRHLLFRRAIPYGDPSRPEDTQGLLFLAACADLRRQFEFVQAHWLAGGDRLGFGPEPDALTGHRRTVFDENATSDDRYDAASIGGTDGRRHRLVGLPNYVTTRGGEYVLLPSRSAMYRIATWPRTR